MSANSKALKKLFLAVFFFQATVIALVAQTKQEVYDRINQERVSRGLPLVPVDRRLERSAQSWAFFMRPTLKHNVNFLRRFHRTGAECLAAGGDPVSGWLNSKPHRQSILGRQVKYMGLGYWRGKWVWRSFTN